jgi:type IV secretory pathway protease TraF
MNYTWQVFLFCLPHRVAYAPMKQGYIPLATMFKAIFKNTDMYQMFPMV